MNSIGISSFFSFIKKNTPLLLILSSILLFNSCKTSRKITKEPLKEFGADYLFEKLKENELKFDWLSAKFDLDLIIDKKRSSLFGQIRMRKDSVIWISLSPALGIEMARLIITQDSVKFVNRINKSFFTGDYSNVNRLLDANIDFDVVQSILIGIDLTYYEEGKFRATIDNREYHLVTAGRQKLKKYIRTREDEERIYIQNILLNPENFKITQMKIKETTKENKKLGVTYSDFHPVDGQLFPQHVSYNLIAEKQVQVELDYSRITIGEVQEFPFRISSNYVQIR